MTQLIGAWTIGLIMSLAALGTYISFRVFRMADITVDGSFAFGAALAATLIARGMDPFSATALALLGGALAGATTGILCTWLRVHHLLAGILVMTALYSVNLRVMGQSTPAGQARSNVPLMNERTLVTEASEGLSGWLRASSSSPGQRPFVHLGGAEIPISELAILGLATMAMFLVAGVLYLFFRTNLGTAMRASGENPPMIRALGANVETLTILGLSLSNLLVAFSGALFAQEVGFADVQIGIGMIVRALAAVIIGEAIVGQGGVGLAIVGTVMGAVLFNLLVAIALAAGMDPNDLKLLTAGFVLAALVLPGVGRKLTDRVRKALRLPTKSETGAR